MHELAGRMNPVPLSPKTRTNRNGQFDIPFIPFIPAKQRKPALNPLNRMERHEMERHEMERHEMERHEFDMPESMPGTTVPANTDQSPPKTGSLPPETFPPGTVHCSSRHFFHQ